MNEKPCPLCGSTLYVWGEVQAQGLRFSPDSDGWLAQNFGSGRPMRARRCDSCRNVQLFDVEND